MMISLRLRQIAALTVVFTERRVMRLLFCLQPVWSDSTSGLAIDLASPRIACDATIPAPKAVGDYTTLPAKVPGDIHWLQERTISP